MSKKSKNKIKKSDYNRVLISETTPFETPIIFSNEGLYDRLNNLPLTGTVEYNLLSGILLGKHHSKAADYTIPYFYKIRKNSISKRRLALPHPNSQLKIRDFYKEFERLIIYHCSRSPASIRAPHKIAGSFYFPSSSENIKQYKDDSLSTLSLEEIAKHSPTFFAYKGYDRLYKFFDSRDYFNLEKSFSMMKTLDVTKCFDSIYTHSISWALKDKEFIKEFGRATATFGQYFDDLMCYCNHGETNGIIIGPEFSRIFSEIIFQEIDLVAIKKIKDQYCLQYEQDYCFRRYVDDVFIFANSEKNISVVYEVYESILNTYNLHANPAKSVFLKRPFVTDKSRLIQDSSIEINDFINKFLNYSKKLRFLKPIEIRSPWKLTRSFVESIKILCSYNDVNYDEISTFLIAVITERIKRLVAIEKLSDPDIESVHYLSAFIVLLDILFFLYQTSPSVGASYKLSTSIILTIRFFKTHLPQNLSAITQRIFELTESLIADINKNITTYIDGVISLEVLNIALATRELDSFHLMPASLANQVFIPKNGPSYFGIISCLFYIRDEARYDTLRSAIINSADKILSDLSDINISSEKAHLFLDLITCPYIPIKHKHRWIRSALKALSFKQPSNFELDSFITKALSMEMHVNWNQVDLLRALEKKELRQAY